MNSQIIVFGLIQIVLPPPLVISYVSKFLITHWSLSMLDPRMPPRLSVRLYYPETGAFFGMIDSIVSLLSITATEIVGINIWFSKSNPN